MADQPPYNFVMECDTKKEAATAALRAQLQSEIKKIKQCAYQAFDCTQLTLEGSKYCLRHILQDKNAPYKQCSYVYSSNGKRCHLPAPIRDKKDTGYCNDHALKLHLSTTKRNSHCQPPRTAEVLLNFVSHYVKLPKAGALPSLQSNENSVVEENEGIVTKSLDPFVDIDANSMLAAGSEVLDMCSESESDLEPTVYGSVWHDAHAESSDNDSVDSEQEDLLKHANIYSAEEVTLITKEKLKRLQSLYIDQYRYLQHALKEHRRRYLFALKHEKETHCNIYKQVNENVKEQRLYKKLKAYNSYHKRHGTEAICVKRLHEKRLKITEGAAPKQQNHTKCIFTEGGVKCGEKTFPGSKYCPKHILEDPNQILFRACGKMCGDIECRTPVETIFDDGACRLHIDFPPIRAYNQVRKDSESDYDETGALVQPISDFRTAKLVELDTNINIKNNFLPKLNVQNTTLKLESDVYDLEVPTSSTMSLVETPLDYITATTVANNTFNIPTTAGDCNVFKDIKKEEPMEISTNDDF